MWRMPIRRYLGVWGFSRQIRRIERPDRPEDCAEQAERKTRQTGRLCRSGRQKDQEDRRIRKTEGSGRQKDQEDRRIRKTEGSEDWTDRQIRRQQDRRIRRSSERKTSMIEGLGSTEDEKLREECGVFGMYDPDGRSVAGEIYYGLFALQHRGQESCGIAVSDTEGPKGRVHVHKGMGLCNEVFTPKILEGLTGNIGVGHVRYSTAGSSTRENAQPLVLNYVKGTLALAHNGNLVNALQLRRELEYGGAIFQTTIDSEVIAYHIARERVRASSVESAVANAMKKLSGAYSLVIASPRKALTRIRHGTVGRFILAVGSLRRYWKKHWQRRHAQTRRSCCCGRRMAASGRGRRRHWGICRGLQSAAGVQAALQWSWSWRSQKGQCGCGQNTRYGGCFPRQRFPLGRIFICSGKAEAL